jgi:hypothetical protein
MQLAWSNLACEQDLASVVMGRMVKQEKLVDNGPDRRVPVAFRCYMNLMKDMFACKIPSDQSGCLNCRILECLHPKAEAG